MKAAIIKVINCSVVLNPCKTIKTAIAIKNKGYVLNKI